jgi:hypothetical protein
MPMAAELGERYRALFHGYGAGRAHEFLDLKFLIASHESVLREDAMYFLLLNLDHMVLQGLSGYIPAIAGGRIAGEPLPPFVEPARAQEMAAKTFHIINDELAQYRKSQPKSSANDVIRAINATTKAISETILWWREG